MFSVSSPYPIFIDLSGSPLDNGLAYFGTANQNPETNPITVYWDEAGLIPAAQPIPIFNGVPTRNGSAANVFVTSDYSVTVRDASSRIVLAQQSSAVQGNELAADLASTASGKGSSLIGVHDPLLTAPAYLKTVSDIQNGDPVSVLRFVKTSEIAAIKDYTTTYDVTADIQDAFTNAPAIIIPQGGYLLSEKLSVTNKAFAIYGAGPTVARLRWISTATSSGIEQTSNDDDFGFTVRDISLFTEQAGLGSAIKSTRSGEDTGGGVVQNRSNYRNVIENVDIRGVDVSNNGWLNGIQLVDSMHTIIRSAHFIGYAGATAANPVTDSFIDISGSKSPTEFVIDSCWGFAAKNSVKVADTVEGVFVDKCNFINVRFGVYWEAAVSDPQLIYTNSHCAAYLGAVYMSKVNQSIISGNLFYKRSGIGSDVNCVELNNCDFTVVSNNTFVNNDGSFGMNHVVCSGDTSYAMVTDNIHQVGTTGVWFQSGTSNCRQKNNTFITLTNTNVLDQSVNNFKPNGATAVATRNSAFSVVNTTPTTMQWDKEGVDDFNGIDLGTDNTKITIPAGVSFVDVEASIVWAANNTGERRISIFKNGTDSARYVPKLVKTAISNSSDSITARMIPVNPGDYFTVVVSQTSGAPLNVFTEDSFMKVTVSDGKQGI